VAADPSPRPGAYDFTDSSVMRPWITRVWFARLLPRVPGWVAANLITLASTGILAVVLAGAVFADQLGPVRLALLQLVAIQVYVAGDHLDGMQAKATGTSSPLGDFLDHHCDLWAGLILVFGFWRLIGPMPAWTLVCYVLLMTGGFAITYVERVERRRLHFTSWGTLEGIVIVTAFYLSWLAPAVRAWWRGPLAGTVPRTAIMYGVGALMASGVITVIARRMGRVPAPLAVAAAQWVALAVWCLRANGLPPLAQWALLSLAGAEYVARVMHAVSADVARPWPDAVSLALVAALWILPPSLGAAVPALALGAWLAARYLATLVRILRAWRQYWTWRNAVAVRRPPPARPG
jgi:ethanolaminephosphotransferase